MTRLFMKGSMPVVASSKKITRESTIKILADLDAAFGADAQVINGFVEPVRKIKLFHHGLHAFPRFPPADAV